MVIPPLHSRKFTSITGYLPECGGTLIPDLIKLRLKNIFGHTNQNLRSTWFNETRNMVTTTFHNCSVQHVISAGVIIFDACSGSKHISGFGMETV